MTNRAIPCPCSDPNYCLVCCGEGTIPDRRTPTAAERAVERIKAMIVLIAASRPKNDEYERGYSEAISDINNIIREEEGR